ncbi:MAG: diaminopimelate epimerase [Sphingomonadales bacterium]
MAQGARLNGNEFLKMHGLGNDFVVLDARGQDLDLTSDEVRSIADRRTGVGCDQLIVVASSERADAAMHIRNADGGSAEACGNAARCIALLIMDHNKTDRATIETPAGVITGRRGEDAGTVSVDMGAPSFGWRDIPLAREVETLHLPLARGPLRDGVAVNIGNPHAVFFVDDADAVDLGHLGPELEHDDLFPARANISVASVTGDDRIRLRVWERGTGLTKACGTGACATLVAAVRRGLIGRRARIDLDGGALSIEWRDDNHIIMTGPAALSFRGRFGDL